MVFHPIDKIQIIGPAKFEFPSGYHHDIAPLRLDRGSVQDKKSAAHIAMGITDKGELFAVEFRDTPAGQIIFVAETAGHADLVSQLLFDILADRDRFAGMNAVFLLRLLPLKMLLGQNAGHTLEIAAARNKYQQQDNRHHGPGEIEPSRLEFSDPHFQFFDKTYFKITHR